MNANELPDIPDYPDAPLTPWRHYGITEYADKKVREELENLGYQGFLIGIRVSYTLVDKDEKTYSMSFGRVPPLGITDGTEDPLSDEFLLRLHENVSMLIHKYSPEVFGEMFVEVSVNVSGSEHTSTIKCLPSGYICTQSHTGRQKCIQRKGGPWTCLHIIC